MREAFCNLWNSSASLDEFGYALVTWYEKHKRPLPWRKTTNPYHILVSETMLQQTRVDTVIPYYHAFLERFPTLATLASAPEADVLKAWQGLGYYSRARNLQKAAKVCVEAYEQMIPDDVDAVRGLPGVGPYTTGAVMSIAFNRPVAAVDGNVLRVMSRFLGIDDPIDLTTVKNTITDCVQSAVEASIPGMFTQAVMELGAVVCTPRKPQCLVCPLADHCVARREGRVTELPKKRPKKARRQVDVVALWIEKDGCLLVERRASEGLLADMWQLPAVERDLERFGTMSSEAQSKIADIGLQRLFQGHTTNEASLVRESDDTHALKYAELTQAKHVFTHIEWNVHVMRPVGFTWPDEVTHDTTWRFVAIEDLPQLAWPKVYEKILEELLQIDVRQTM